MKHLLLIFGLSIAISSSTFAQRVLQPKLIEFDFKGVVYKEEKALNLRVQEFGLAIGYYQGQILSYDKTKYYTFDIGFMRDIRERRQSKNFNLASPANTFVYGKINSVINLRASVGRKRYLSEKAQRRGLAVGYSYDIGPSIALMKPYYIELSYTTESGINSIQSTKYTEDNAAQFLNYDNIIGASPYIKGLSEIKVVPGLHAKTAVHFALGAFDQYMKTVEAGVMVDVFTKPLPILYETEEYNNQAIYVRLFVAFQFGVRTTK